MKRRFRVVMLVVVSLLLVGCGSANLPAGVTPGSTDAQKQEQGESANGAPVPDAAVPESVDGAPALSPEAGQPVAPVDIHCTETDPHPIGQSIAETYHVTYEEVMTFFCTGVGFDDIVLAYQTAELSGRDVKEVLTLWYDLGNWDDVWGELGIE